MSCSFIDFSAGVVAALILISVVVDLFYYWRFLKVLSASHSDEWSRLGRPAIIGSEGSAVDWAVTRFLWRREYEWLSDPNLTSAARVIRGAWIIGAILMAGFLLLVLVSAHRLPFFGFECLVGGASIS